MVLYWIADSVSEQKNRKNVEFSHANHLKILCYYHLYLPILVLNLQVLYQMDLIWSLNNQFYLKLALRKKTRAKKYDLCMFEIWILKDCHIWQWIGTKDADSFAFVLFSLFTFETFEYFLLVKGSLRRCRAVPPTRFIELKSSKAELSLICILYEFFLIRLQVRSTKRMNFYNYHIRSIFKSHSISVTFKSCAVLGAQGTRATGFKRAQGNAHCVKFESHTNEWLLKLTLLEWHQVFRPYMNLLNWKL